MTTHLVLRKKKKTHARGPELEGPHAWSLFQRLKCASLPRLGPRAYVFFFCFFVIFLSFFFIALSFNIEFLYFFNFTFQYLVD